MDDKKQVGQTSKVSAKPKNAMELRALVSKRSAYGVKLVDQYKHSRG